MRYFFQVVIMLFGFNAVAQINGDSFGFDTLKIEERTNGSLDSIAFQSRSSSMVFPLLSSSSTASFLSPFSLFSPSGNIFHTPFQKSNPFTFLAIPHIGVAYTFGSQGSQHLTLNYSQVFRTNFIFNLSATNDATAGFYRNSTWKSTAYKIGLAKNAKCYSFRFAASYAQERRDLSTGIVADSLAPLFDLTLIPVRREDAFSTTSLRQVELTHFIDFASKDSTQFLGLIVASKLRSMDRYYQESGQLAALYPLVQFDSTVTADHYGLVDLSNQISIGSKRGKSFANLGVNANYWRYANQGNIRDTMELSLIGSFESSWKNWRLNSSSSFNFIGAKFASSVKTAFIWKKKNHYLAIESSLDNIAPLPIQRFYQANNTSYSLVDFNLQGASYASVLFKEKIGIHHLAFMYRFLSTSQVYIFDGQSWLNNSSLSNQSINQIVLNGSLQLGTLAISPRYELTLMDEAFRFYPMHTVSSRLLVKGGIFKAKKLKALAAVDFLFSSRYKAPILIPSMTSFDFSSLPNAVYQKPMLNAGILVGFEVETFRFFARMDNIAYFFTDRSQLFFEGYTLPTWQLKFGLTWDFWN